MRLHRLLLAVTLVLTVLLSVVSTMAQQPLKPLKKKPEVPYVPTHEKVVAEMLKVAKVGKNDILYDLGSGDGRIVITAAKRFGTRGVGVDIDPARITEARENAVKAGVADKVKFLQQDLFETDIREATLVTLFLLPEVNLRLRPKLLSDLKRVLPSGSTMSGRICSCDGSLSRFSPTSLVPRDDGAAGSVRQCAFGARLVGRARL
jgi:SAM-dependent methyltransferase